MRKRILLLLAGCYLSAVAASAQDLRIRKAEEAMQSLQYQEAIRLYEEILSKKPDQALQLSLAEAYRKNQDYERAAAAFAQVQDWAQAAPEYLVQYGRVLMQTESCTAAQPVFDNFIERKPFDPRVNELRDVCAYLSRIRTQNEDIFTVSPAAFNSSFNEMAPAIFGSGLVFASNSQSLKGEFLDLFYADNPAEDASTRPFAAELNTKLHEATASFSSGLDRMFFTRSRETTTPIIDSRIVPLEILTATRQPDGAWSKPEALNLSDPAYSAAHPCLSPDGNRLFFSSDRPGGFGGKDIYYAEWTGTSWAPPVNLGPDINTEGDELYPFLHADNRLFFSSDGHIGLGGIDIFFAEQKTDGAWSPVENMGAPFNSTHDDFALVFSPGGLSGFFSSNREGGAGGDDIYRFQRLFFDLELSVQDAVTGQIIEEPGMQSDCTIQGNKLRVAANGCCDLTASAAGYESARLQICGKDIDPQYVSSPWPVKLEAEKIYTLSGTVADENTGTPLAGAAIHVFDPAGQLALALVSDQDGRFSSRLPAKTCYSFKVEKGDYFARTLDEKVCAQGSTTLYVLDVLLQPFWISAAQANRQLRGVEPSAKGVFLTGTATGADDKVPFLLQIYYDQFSAFIRQDALPEMERLWKLLEDNPNIVIEISSHTDSRGDKSFNQRLSQKRAENVVKWLIDRGVERKRLVAKGYGESRPVNRCVDGVTCPDSEHQFNRRTEFRVVGKVK